MLGQTPVGGNAWDTFAVKAMSKEKPPVPEGLDWDLWLGPAPYRDYHPITILCRGEHG